MCRATIPTCRPCASRTATPTSARTWSGSSPPPPLRPTGAAQCVAPLQNMAERVDAQVDVPRWLPELVFGDLDELRSAVKRPGVNMEDFV
mmetsp:Transcript_19357/g.62382  ORF Transcript_19357/g.62382 Transcript_19357/m.62382 type:complete len:90 (-) Transcript_19357:300-569(-)